MEEWKVEDWKVASYVPSAWLEADQSSILPAKGRQPSLPPFFGVKKILLAKRFYIRYNYW
jgi:hypothetical protein